MPPTSSSSGNPSPAPTGDLGATLEQERLPAGLDRLAEPLVEHSQRERLLNAMARSCAKKGYGATTIADVCEGAGVSRATFYELFKDKEDCFHASMEVALADAMGRIVAVYSPDKPWATMVRDAAAAFLDLLASRPTFARMALVEAPSSGERAFELYSSGKRVLQSLLERGRDDPVEEEAIPSSAGRAALSAAESLIVGQILAGNTARLRELLPDVVYITTVPYLGQEEALRQAREAEKAAVPADGCGVPAARGQKRERWRPPRGRHRLPPEVIARSQRERLLEAAIRVVAEKGYAATTVADLTREAGISRTTFYAMFDDKEGCFLAAYDNVADALVRRIALAYEAEEGWPRRARAGLAALLEALAEEPEAARLALVDVGAAGPAAQRRYRAALQRLTPFFDEGRDFAPGGRNLPANTSRMAIGAVAGLISDELVEGRAEYLPKLLSEVLFATLVPYIGPAAAAREVGEKTR